MADIEKASGSIGRRTALALGLATTTGLIAGTTAQAAESKDGVKVTVLYGAPKSPEEFEKYYLEKHMPKVYAITEIRHVEISKGLPNPDGKPPAFYRIAELWFDSPEQFGQVMAMPSMKAVVADVPNFASGGATVVVSQMG